MSDDDRGAPRIGRRIMSGVYALLVVYVIGSGIVSVVPQIFWPAEAHGVSPAEPAEGCPAALLALEAELREHAADAARDLDGRSSSPEASRAWLDTWDGRYRALEPSCGRLRSYPLLARVRYAVEDSVLRSIADTAPTAAEARRAIEAERDPR